MNLAGGAGQPLIPYAQEQKHMKKAKILLMAAMVLSFAGLLHGCAKEVKLDTGPVFWPSPPAEPHIQFLGGMSDSVDIEGKQTGFSLIVTGQEDPTFIKKIGKGSGITAHGGKLYVASTGFGQIVVIDIANRTFDYLKGNTGSGKLKKPVNTAIDDQGNIYVADTGRGQIVVFDAAGNYLRAFGNFAEDGSTSSRVVDVAFFRNKLYALDNRAGLIRVLDPQSGRELNSFGQEEADERDNLSLPYAFTIDAQGIIYITNLLSGRVLKYDVDGNFLDGLGRLGQSFGEFARPRGVAVDSAGLLYVADAGFSNVQVFDKQKRLLGFFGTPGLPAGSLNLPAGIAVTTDNLEYFQKMAAPGFKLEQVIFVVNQYTSPINPVISVYGYGSMAK
jgi:DNA-binding beta-propeller fold protein YncE